MGQDTGNYTNIEGTADTVILTRRGKLRSVVINEVAANGYAVALYDEGTTDATASKLIANIVVNSPQRFEYNCELKEGLFVNMGSTDGNVTITYQ